MNFERNKKYVAKNTIVDKTVAKEKKAKSKKQETKNKEHIVEWLKMLILERNLREEPNL